MREEKGKGKKKEQTRIFSLTDSLLGSNCKAVDTQIMLGLNKLSSSRFNGFDISIFQPA